MQLGVQQCARALYVASAPACRGVSLLSMRKILRTTPVNAPSSVVDTVRFQVPYNKWRFDSAKEWSDSGMLEGKCFETRRENSGMDAVAAGSASGTPMDSPLAFSCSFISSASSFATFALTRSSMRAYLPDSMVSTGSGALRGSARAARAARALAAGGRAPSESERMKAKSV